MSVNTETGALSLRLATAPVNWNNNDIPGWRPLTPFPAILDRMRDAGYAATEYDGSFGANAQVLVDEVSSRGMSWCGTYKWVDFLDTDRLAETIANILPLLDLMDAIDCRNLIVADALRRHRVALAGRVPADRSASLSPADVRTLADGVHRLAEVARARNISVRYHNHVGSYVEAPHEVEDLIGELDPSVVDLCFDTGHYAYGGGNAAAFIRDHHERIGYLHLKDVHQTAVASSREQGHTFIEALTHYVFSPIGEGVADIPAILDVLVSHGFDGWVVVEQDTCEGDATDTARSNRKFIDRWLIDRRAGSPHKERVS